LSISISPADAHISHLCRLTYDKNTHKLTDSLDSQVENGAQ